MVRPEIAACFRVEIVAPDAILLLGAGRERILRGRVYPLLAPLLDGSRSTEQIVDALERRCDPAEVYFALDTMRRGDLIAEAGSSSDPAAAYWSGLRIDPSAARGALEKATVRVVGLGEMPTDVLAGLLAEAGVRIVSQDAALDVVIVCDYLDPRLAAVNSVALATGRAWLLASPLGSMPLAGPQFVPGETGCWECLAQRLRHQRPLSTFAQSRNGGFQLPPTGSPATIGAALHLTAALLTQSLAGHSTDLRGAVYSLDLSEWSAARHVLVRRPQCRACGVGSPGSSRLPDQPRRDGGRRSRVGPDDTLARHGHHVSPVTGIVSRLTALPSVDGVNLVYMAGRNFAFPASDLPSLRLGLRSMSSGKGITHSHARASALCEALERYSGVFQGDEARTSGSYNSLGPDAVHPAALLQFSEAQYEDREAWNARGSSFCRVPRSFDDDEPAEWTPAWSITVDRPRYLPTSYCYYGYHADPDRRFCIADSNGCAAGNTINEAIVQGLLELVERDAVAIWWYNRLAMPRLDLNSAGDPGLAAVTARYVEGGREVWALDLTSDLGIPVYAAISRRIGAPAENILFGFGCHLDPAAALHRALAELNQVLSRVASVDLSPDAARGFGDPGFRVWWADAALADHRHLVGDGRASCPPSAFSPDRLGSDEDLLYCRRAVERIGMEVIVLDQTRADVGLPVVRVVVPGLRHFWPRFGPGRLYQAPVAMGRLDAPLAEDALNPVAMFL